jgi:hypothetical protein
LQHNKAAQKYPSQRIPQCGKLQEFFRKLSHNVESLRIFSASFPTVWKASEFFAQALQTFCRAKPADFKAAQAFKYSCGKALVFYTRPEGLFFLCG